MAVFYKGVGYGRYYCDNDARLNGIEARDPQRRGSGDMMIRHIVDGTEGSPYISLTKSYSVALAYARMGRRMAAEESPAVVHEISVESEQSVRFVDPVLEIARNCAKDPSYQHDGLQSTLMGLVDPAHAHWLQFPIFRPPPGGAPRQGPHVSRPLTAMVRALRDAEVLVVGSIPKECIQQRFIGWDTKWRLDY